MQKTLFVLACILLGGLLGGCRTASAPTPTISRAIPTTSPALPASATAPSPSPTATGDHKIFLPAASDDPTLTPAPTASPTVPATPTPGYPPYDGPPLARSDIGIQIHLHRENLDEIFSHLEALDVGWVKTQVSWKLYEPSPGQYDEFRLQELDRLVERADAAGIDVLLSVAKAPEWSRPTTEMDGPPTDTTRFREFMHFLAERYRGRVAAYELWNEPNLQREWNGFPLDPTALVALIEQGATGVRSADPGALLVSGAPATTGINDGQTAIDDRVFLQGMLAAGVGELVDAVGAHPYGWANPATASASDAEQVAPTHNNHPSFFFADTVRDYQALLEQAGYAELPLWATEFGWGAAEGMGSPPPEGAEFMQYVSEWQQAEYTLDAYAMAQQSTELGPLFLWNLNFAPTFGAGFSESFYSVLRPDGSRRPVYQALHSVPRS